MDNEMLGALLERVEGNAVWLCDDGNGSGLSPSPVEPVMVPWDEGMKWLYWNVRMTRLPQQHPCGATWASDWVIRGEGTNPYRVQILA
jgi:hypothetical protein